MTKYELQNYLKYTLIMKYNLKSVDAAEQAANEIADTLMPLKEKKGFLKLLGKIAESTANIFIQKKLSKI